MTSPIGTIPRANDGSHRRRGAFTLIELILVLTLLSVVISLASPTLSRFFRGRALDEEGRRFLALTRYGQSRAVSEALPMVLWVQPAEGKFGLRVQDGYSASGTVEPGASNTGGSGSSGLSGVGKDVEFQLAEKLKFVLDRGSGPQNREGTIRFAADGTIAEGSVQAVEIRQDDGASVTIVQAENQVSYVIEQETNGWSRASR